MGDVDVMRAGAVSFPLAVCGVRMRLLDVAGPELAESYAVINKSTIVCVYCV